MAEVSAAIIASENFNYANGAFNEQAGGTGWSTTGWAANGAATIVTRNGASVLQINQVNSNAVISRALEASTSASTLFVSFLLEVNSNTVDGDADDFLALWLDNTVGTGNHSSSRPNMGINSRFQFARVNVGNSASAGTAATAGVVYQIVARFSKGTGYQNTSFWVNPGSDELGTPDVSVNGVSVGGFGTISQVGIRTANLETTGGTDIFWIDDLVIATEWTDLTFVPEPGVGVLGLLAGTVWLGGRRRRRGVG